LPVISCFQVSLLKKLTSSAQSPTSMPVVSASEYVQVGWMPSSRPGKIDATVSWPIEPPDQPLPST